jgi:hypothetical protein
MLPPLFIADMRHLAIDAIIIIVTSLSPLINTPKVWS